MIRSRFSLAAFALLIAASVVHAQATATVKCTDGSSSQGGKGACSGHGGIAAAKADAKKDAKADSKMNGAKMEAKADAKADAKMDSKAKPAPKMDSKAKPAPKMDDKGSGKPTATCKDGTQSFAKNHSGACSKHGGVKEWLDGTAKK